MLIIISDTTVLNMDKFETMMINSRTNTTKTKTGDGFLGLFPTYEEKTDTTYVLSLKYTRGTNQMTFTNESPDYNHLRNIARNVVTQLRSLDSSMVDQAFEDAFLKEK